MHNEIKIKDKTLLLSPADYAIVKDFKWYYSNCSIYTKVKSKKISLSKMLYDINKHQIPFKINGNPFDYRRENIKVVTRAEFARLLNKSRKSRFKNVHLYKNHMWSSHVEKDGVRHFNGRYHKEIDAAIVSDYVAAQLWGYDNTIFNFNWKSKEQLDKVYKKLLIIHGDTLHKRSSIRSQGKTLNIKKTSKYIGVYWFKPHSKWSSTIAKDKQKYFLGYFDNEIDAAKAYDKKALELYGSHAKVNFPI